MSYSKQTWDTTSYVNPTRMNHIEDGIKGVSDEIDNLSASDVAYNNTQSGLSAGNVQGAIDEVAKPAFTEAPTRANINSGESLFTILGKIKKYFTDLKAVAFSGSATDVAYDSNTTVKQKIDDIDENIVIEFNTDTISASSMTPNVINTYLAPIPAKAGYTPVLTWFVGINSNVDWTMGITNIIPHSNGRNLAFIPSSGINISVTFAIMYKKL